jgi:hypothetical protein
MLIIGELVDDSPNSALGEALNVEIDQQAHLAARQPQVGQQLSAMNTM